jgi:octaprenyl-diphosphate synthase
MNMALELSTNLRDTELPGVAEILNRRAMVGGKRLRPWLVKWASEVLGLQDKKKLLSMQVVAERVHSATLIHDDLIDEAPMRRGKPTLNSEGHNRRAVIAGDYLLTRALLETSEVLTPATMRELHAMLVKLVEGEWLQVEARGVVPVSLGHLLEVAEKKTASLLEWCCVAPAMEMGASQEVIGSLRRVGRGLGVGFQKVDDCVDFSPHSGKPYAQDLREGLINFVMEDFLRRKPDQVGHVREWMKTLAERTPWAAADLQESLSRVRRSARVDFDCALEELNGLQKELGRELGPQIQTLTKGVELLWNRQK